MKKINVLSLFDGIACGYEALNKAGIQVDTYYASEIDKYAIAIASKNHPDIIQLGDVNNVDFTKFIGKIDLIMGGSPCFVADTLVMTDCGFKPIQNIKVGDYVLTHKSRYRKVLNIGNKVVDKLYKIKGLGFDEILTTEEHPFYVREMYRKWNVQRRSSDRLFTSPEWIKTKDLHKNHYLSSTFNTELKDTFSVYTTDFWYFVGRFTGDGWVRQTKRKYRKNSYVYQVLICCGKNEKEELKAIFDKIGYNYNISEDKTTYKFTICNQHLVEFLKECGIGAKNKIVHPLLWSLPIEFKRAFLEGYMSADGYFIKEKNIFSATTISRELAYGIKQLAMEVYNTCPKIYFIKTKPKKVLEGRIINQNNQYIIRYCLQKNKQDKAFFENNISWQPYKTTEIINKKSIVYNLEVEEDNSYTANSIVVHNCQDLSIAKHDRKGLQGQRSGLFYRYLEAIETIKPRYFLFENVASMKQEDKDKITQLLGVEPILINSALVSAQQRKRLYWTNIPNITQPEDKHIYLEDIVEPDTLIDRDKSHAILTSIGSTTEREYFKKNQGQLVYIAIMLSNIYGGFQEKKPRVKVDKSFCIRTARGGGHIPSLIIEGKTKEISLENFKQCIRKVTPLECERLQTLPDNYTAYGIDGKISNTQRYKCVGNGWTVDVIAHIFSFLKQELDKL